MESITLIDPLPGRYLRLLLAATTSRFRGTQKKSGPDGHPGRMETEERSAGGCPPLAPSKRAIRPSVSRPSGVIPANPKLGGYVEAYRNSFSTALVVRRLDAGLAIRAFCYTLPILALNFAAIAGFSCRYPVRVLLGNGSIARIWVDLSGSRSVTANRLTAAILDAIARKQTGSK